MPTHVRDAIDAIAGSPVVRASNVGGGFSPGPAARCELADGRLVFVKACGAELNPFAPRLHRREAAIMATLPSSLPVPQLIGVHDDGDWVALVLEHIDGRMPVAPLPAEDVSTILSAIEMLADLGTPAPPLGVPRAGTNETASGRPLRWHRVAADFAGTGSGLDEWSRRHLDTLIELEAPWIEAVAGNSLLHGDLRTDNILITPTTTYIVDWPAAAVARAMARSGGHAACAASRWRSAPERAVRPSSHRSTGRPRCGERLPRSAPRLLHPRVAAAAAARAADPALVPTRSGRGGPHMVG